MPELPEVETTKRGIAPHIEGKLITRVISKVEKLRYPVPDLNLLVGTRVKSVSRRAKYLLIELSNDQTLIWHLGMSGSFLVSHEVLTPNKHEHIQLVFEDETTLRYNDPRKFGCVLLTDNSESHPLLSALGPEPLSEAFNGTYLKQALKKRKAAIKQVIMDNKIVVGVGNIYANEALFISGIRPKKTANNLTQSQVDRLVASIKQTIGAAIMQGGTTLRDFTGGDGKPGYFSQVLQVYGRDGETCYLCENAIKRIELGQRGTYYCPNCQK